jgi:hypothetical protein
MLDEPQRECLKKNLRPMQIIVAAFAAGVLAFMGVMPFFPAGGGEDGPANSAVMQYIGLGLTIAAVLAWVIVPSFVAARLRQAIADGKPFTNRPTVPAPPEIGDVRPVVEMYQTRLLLSAAILEGAAFFNLVIYMCERQPLNLALAGALVFILLTQMPTLGRWQSWTESELATLKQLRAMGPKHGR